MLMMRMRRRGKKMGKYGNDNVGARVRMSEMRREENKIKLWFKINEEFNII